MSTIWFEITTKAGEVIKGPVQGSGGMIGDGISNHVMSRDMIALQRLRHAIADAENGDWNSALYDDHYAIVYPEHDAMGNGPPIYVDLRGAKARLDHNPNA